MVAIGSIAGVGAVKDGPPDHGSNENKDKGGPPSDAKNTCPDDAALLAKYEVGNGDFVFEKDSDCL